MLDSAHPWDVATVVGTSARHVAKLRSLLCQPLSPGAAVPCLVLSRDHIMCLHPLSISGGPKRSWGAGSGLIFQGRATRHA